MKRIPRKAGPARNRMPPPWCANLLVALSLAAAFVSPLVPAAEAHTKSTSYSRWNLDVTEDGARTAKVQLRMPLLELTRFPVGHDWPSYLQSHLRLMAGDETCTATAPLRQATEPSGWAIFRWQVTCPATGDLRLRSDVLADVLSTHLHFARVADPESGIRERVLVAGSPEWPLAASAEAASDETAGTTIGGYIALGVEHILAGWDHLAFVAALLLLSASLREVLTLVTAFTLAHSITLGLAVVGFLRPEPVSVEILIGFSIALVAAENSWLLAGRGRGVPAIFTAALAVAALLAATGGNLVAGTGAETELRGPGPLAGALPAIAWAGLALFSWCHFGLLDHSHRPERLRAMVAFAFGLVHGFGFAGVLMEIDLPTERLLPALFGFNIGVELGQVVVVAVVWPLLRALARQAEGAWYRLLAETGSAAICGLGLYWVVMRNWG